MVLIVIAALFFGFFGLIAYGTRQRLGALRRCPQRTCAEATPGPELVRLSGSPRADEPLISPLTRTPCVYYSLTIMREDESPGSQGDSDSADVPYASSRKWARWRLEDATGSIEVDGEGAEVLATRRRSTCTGQGDPERLERLLDEYQVPRGPLVFCHVTEKVLPAAASVIVCGRVRRGADGEPVLGGGEEMQVSGTPDRDRLRRDRRVFAFSAAAGGLSLLALITGVVRLAGAAPSEPEVQRLAADPAVDIKRPDQPAVSTAEGEALPAEAPIDSQRSE